MPVYRDEMVSYDRQRAIVEATEVVTGVDDAFDGACDEDRPRRRYN